MWSSIGLVAFEFFLAFLPLYNILPSSRFWPHLVAGWRVIVGWFTQQQQRVVPVAQIIPLTADQPSSSLQVMSSIRVPTAECFEAYGGSATTDPCASPLSSSRSRLADLVRDGHLSMDEEEPTADERLNDSSELLDAF
ncbi:unnamed protein product, partial [Mesorhabditis belari]|uniref:Uncharacterized protein n=1 Tax=Mesorhabditis belari TaxID=2138241 RepID=A0AAF3ENH3_9BILA